MSKSYVQEESYILEAIDASGYDATPTTAAELLQFLHDTFHSEYSWEIKRIGSYMALKDWLQGLPSSISIAFYNHDILELYKKWNNINTMTEREEDKILSMYWRFMAMRIKSLWLKHGIN